MYKFFLLQVYKNERIIDYHVRHILSLKLLSYFRLYLELRTHTEG
jgi:hypothetical protein